MITKTGFALPLLGLACGSCLAAAPAELKTENDKISYSVGYRLGGDFKRQQVDLNPDMLLKGIEDASSGGTPLMTEDEMRSVMTSVANRVKVAQMEALKNRARRTSRQGKPFSLRIRGRTG